MHISEGVLSIPVLAAGAAFAAGGIAMGLRQLKPEQMLPTALFSSAFFVSSLIHVPLPPASAHLILNGLMGLALGWRAFPAMFIALALQAFQFQFGGLTTLGVNTCIMALPPVLCWCGIKPVLRFPNPLLRMGAAFACGALAVLGSATLAALALTLSGEAFTTAALTLFAAHLPIALCEGLITLFVVSLLSRVRPEFLDIPPLPQEA